MTKIRRLFSLEDKMSLLLYHDGSLRLPAKSKSTVDGILIVKPEDLIFYRNKSSHIPKTCAMARPSEKWKGKLERVMA